ncbi:MAG: hypothetical protein QOG52_1189, partial [Frankiaceae bacterium]|jgi:RNA polymerase sigma factor (sigma-70 family)|nr:hypothetical protein [Frankiaceae bacterium]
MSARDTPVAVAASGGDGYKALYQVHFRGLVQLATLLGADDPENVVQESFVRLQRNEAQLRDVGATVAYLRATVCNVSRSRVRHLVLARRYASRLLRPGDASVEQTAVMHEDHREVLAALERLPRRPREVLVLRYWSELSEADIATTLGISPGSVKSYASRGLAAIEKQLGRLS